MTTTRRALRAAAAVLVTGLFTALPAHAAPAATGHLRLAHLSPDTPKVDVYLTAVAGSPAPRTFPAVGYGVVSPYLALPTGQYTVAMRKAGAAPATPPVLSTAVTVESGQAYTIAGVGRYAELGLKVIEDDLTPPAAQRARVRVVHASVRVPELDLTLGGDTELATGARFATTSDYRDVPAGRQQLRVTPRPEGAPADVPVTLEAGAVYSLLVLDGAGGKLTVEPRLDAKGSPVMPVGAIDAGAGGGATGIAAGWAVAAATLLVTAFLLVRRRPRPVRIRTGRDRR